jgi:hypothetical protein
LFERVYAYPAANDRLVFKVGYHNPWRLYEVAGCLDRLDLDQIISNPNYAGGQSHLRLVGTFLWRHGRFKNFIDRLHDRDLKGRENYLAAAFDRPMTEVVALWRDYLAEVPSESSTIPQMPVSQIYSTQQEFEAAMAEATAQPSWPKWVLGRVFQRVNPPGCPIRAQSTRVNPVKAQPAIPDAIAADGEIGRLVQEALAASRARDHRRAAELYTQALAIEPGPNDTSRDLHAGRGSQYNFLRMPAQALADYDAALQIGYSGPMRTRLSTPIWAAAMLCSSSVNIVARRRTSMSCSSTCPTRCRDRAPPCPGGAWLITASATAGGPSPTTRPPSPWTRTTPGSAAA